MASRNTVRVRADQPEGRHELGRGSVELRSELARELHDRVAQTLTSILMDLEVFKMEQAGQQVVLSKVDSVQHSMREVLSSLRDLLHDLRAGSSETGVDLRQGLSTLLAGFEGRTGIESTLVVQSGWPAQTRPAAGFNLYRIAEEALVNVSRHSGAKGVRVSLQAAAGDELSMTITDYGRGFDQKATTGGMGTAGMQERAVLVGGRLWIDSFPGYGTRVHVTLPRSAVTRGM